MAMATTGLESELLLERFPNAKAVATSDVVKVMGSMRLQKYLRRFGRWYFLTRSRIKPVIAEELKGNIIQLEGHDLVAVKLGDTDTDHTACLNVPSIGLVVAGDAAYNDVHLYLVESNTKSRLEWISALDKIESLNSRSVIAAHKQPNNDDNPRIIEETGQYIRDFDRLVEETSTAQESITRC